MIRRLFRAVGHGHTGGLRTLLGLLGITAVLQGVAFVLLVPVLRALLGPEPGTVWAPLAGFLAAGLAYLAVAFVAQNTGFRVGSQIARRLHHRLGEAIAALPLGWFTPGRVGELARLNSQSVLQVMSLPAHQLRPLSTALVTSTTVAIGMYAVDVRLALAITIASPVLVAVLLASNRMVARSDRGRDATIHEAAARVVEYAQAQPVLRAFGRIREGYRMLDDALVAQRDADRRMLRLAVPGLVSFAFAVRALFAALLVLTAYLALGGALDAPTALAVLVLAARFTESIGTAAELGAGLRLSGNALARITEVLDTPRLPEPQRPRRPQRHDVEFDEVRFGYEPGTPVLRGVSFTLPERSVTALVGPSGSGKTTVGRLLARFFDPDAGEVRVGGVDVREIASDDLIARVSMVFQDVYLFEGTLADNVRIGRPGATDADLAGVATLAGLDQVVAELPDGWDTRVGEGGSTLSGGQRQRVSIARALLKDAPIVVLDEATAALDPENDATIGAALAELGRRATLLVIAHRIRTVLAADQILVLRDGVIAERGRHDELVGARGTYTQFWEQRSRAAGWRLVKQ